MTNNSIKLAFERMWQHVIAALNKKANTSDLTSHVDDATSHITSAERTNWNAAKSHADSTHAPSGAQANVIESIKVNGVAQTITSKSVNITVPTDNKSLANGAGYLVASDIANKADKAITLAGYGITDAAAKSHVHDDKYYTETEIDTKFSDLVGDTAVPTQVSTALSSAKSYTDGEISKLLNNSTEAIDSIYELRDAMKDNVDAISALETIAGSKASANDLTAHIDNKSNPHGVTLEQLGVNATAAELNIMDGVTATTTELNYVDGVTSNIQTQLDAKVPTTRKVNGKVLSADITLSASDVGADASGAAAGALISAKSYTDAEIAEWVGDKTVASQISTAVSGKANTSDLTSHTGNTTAHIISTERTNWNAAKSHADSAHAPSNAEPNQNAFSNVTVGNTTITADSKTDTLTLAGSNVTITPDATNDKVTIGITKANVTAALGYTPPTADTTYGAAGSSLGLVKSGGDVTITDGVITVNDDSHAHVISNVDGLQSALDAKATVSALSTLSGLVGDTAVSTQIETAIANKVDKVSGKGLSTNDLTATLKSNYDAAYTHTSNTSNPHGVTKAQVGLGNVENKSSATIRSEITSANVTTALGFTPSKSDHTHAYIPTSEKGAASGVATLDTSGKVPSSQLPSYVDDVIEGYYLSGKFYKTNSTSGTVITGETGKIYVDLGAGKTYRWSGSAYAEISASIALGETSSTAYAGDKGKANATAIADLKTKVGDTAVATQISNAISAIPNATTSAAGLMSATDKTKSEATNIAYGTCSTAAATAAKVVTISGNTNWKLVAGSTITVLFDATNTAENPTLNVNNTGAKNVFYASSQITTSSLGYAGTASRPMTFMYDGTQYRFIGWGYDSNTTYTNVKLGHGYATCSTAAATTAKVASLSSYTLTTGGIVAVRFTYDVPAGATLNINSKGAKAIYHKNAAITAGVIKAGDTATFIYSTYYRLISIDRWEANQNAFSNVKVGSTTIAADTTTDTLELVAGSNITITPDATNDKITIAATDTTYTFNGAVSTIKDSNLTASRALISNSSGKVAVSAVTSTELGYLDGVTSAIQTQLNGKAASSHNHAASDITSGTLSSDRLPTVPVANGGTGATTAAAARDNLGVSALIKAGSVANSVALNNNNTSSGEYAVASGHGTIASAYASFAEGLATDATNEASHAEGYSTVASGYAAHAEGHTTVASGDDSHAEGWGTVAGGDYQHVEGKWNVKDTTDTYAHIVGNGTSDTARSNAHTVDWNGNAWYKGDVYVGGASQSAGQRLLKTSVCCARGSSSSLSLAATTITTVTLDTWVSRTDTSFTFSNGGIKCPVAGTVRISGGVYIQGMAGNGSAGVYIYKGSSEIASNYAYLNQTSHAETVINVAAGDVIYLKARSATVATCVPNNVATQLNVQYI